MKTERRLIISIFISLIFSASLFAQMPPHPSLLKKISNGEIEVPYTLQHLKELRAKGIDKEWDAPINKFLKKNRMMLNKKGINSTNSVTGNYNALVVLVDFSDKPFKTIPEYFDRLLFSNNPNTLINYLNEITYGELSLTTANLPSEIEVVRAPHTYIYYDNNQNGQGAYPQNAQRLVEDVINIIDPTVDFSKYDNDSDGTIDAFFIVHSGPGAEYTGKKSDIWSHSWNITPQRHDGVNISRYSIEPEYWAASGDMTCGVFAHEMGHSTFGLPDLYDYDTGTNASEGLGNWSLMAGGSWNGNNGSSPAHPDAWCKLKMGTINYVNIISNEKDFQINNLEENQIAYRIWKSGAIGKEYFLLENRQKIGYDAALPGRGLLIYHIDENIISTSGYQPNNKEWYPGHTADGHYGVALEQADGDYELEKNINGGNAGDPFPGSTENTQFTATSSPDNKSYSGDYNNFSFTNIKDSSGIILLDIFTNDYFNVSTSKINYGNIHFSTLNDTARIYLINNGTNPVTLNSISHFNNDFTVKCNLNLPGAVNGGEQIPLEIDFLPSAKGLIEDSIFINYTTDNTIIKKIILKGFSFEVNPVEENVIYGAIKKSAQGSFITLNSADGSGTMIGMPGFPDARSVTISNHSKFLYGLSSSVTSSELLQINVKDGDAYSVLSLDSVLVAVAFDTSDVMYGISDAGSLYKVNLTNGHCTFIGRTGLKITGLAFNPNNNQLYGSIGLGSVNKDGIYKINIDNATPTLVGNTGFNNFTSCITFDTNGNLYGIRNTLTTNNDLIKIDPNTGSGTIIGNTNFKGVKGIAIFSGKTTGVDNNTISGLPTNFNLEQNFPNPFNPATVISYQLPVKSIVRLTVFDILGKKVATLVNEEQNAGFHSYHFSITNYQLPSGIYIYQLSANDFIQSRKMIILK